MNDQKASEIMQITSGEIDIYLDIIESLRLELKHCKMFIWVMIHSNGGEIVIDDQSHTLVNDNSEIEVTRDGMNRKVIYRSSSD